jgi:hypothetical protein
MYSLIRADTRNAQIQYKAFRAYIDDSREHLLR